MRVPAAKGTFWLVVISTGVFLLMHTQFIEPESVAHLLWISGGAHGLAEIRGGQWWRLVTPVFLHFGLFHLVFNLLWVWELGRHIEERHGTPALLGMTAFIAVASNLAQYVASGPLFGGMSGVLYGFFGYMWIQGQFNPRFGMQLMPPIVVLLLGWFVICWSGLLTLFGLQVANSAHTGGLLAGILLALPGVFMARFARGRAR